MYWLLLFFIFHCEMTFICKDFAYGAENPALIIIFCVKTLGGPGRCHWNVHIFCCTSSPNEELDAEFSYYCLPNFLIFDQLNRTFHIEIRLVDNWLINKNSFKCTHAPMFVFSGTQGKWTRNFRGNCLSQLVILLLVWLVSRLSPSCSLLLTH